MRCSCCDGTGEVEPRTYPTSADGIVAVVDVFADVGDELASALADANAAEMAWRLRGFLDRCCARPADTDSAVEHSRDYSDGYAGESLLEVARCIEAHYFVARSLAPPKKGPSGGGGAA